MTQSPVSGIARSMATARKFDNNNIFFFFLLRTASFFCLPVPVRVVSVCVSGIFLDFFLNLNPNPAFLVKQFFFLF